MAVKRLVKKKIPKKKVVAGAPKRRVVKKRPALPPVRATAIQPSLFDLQKHNEEMAESGDLIGFCTTWQCHEPEMKPKDLKGLFEKASLATDFSFGSVKVRLVPDKVDPVAALGKAAAKLAASRNSGGTKAREWIAKKDRSTESNIHKWLIGEMEKKGRLSVKGQITAILDSHDGKLTCEDPEMQSLYAHYKQVLVTQDFQNMVGKLIKDVLHGVQMRSHSTMYLIPAKKARMFREYTHFLNQLPGVRVFQLAVAANTESKRDTWDLMFAQTMSEIDSVERELSDDFDETTRASTVTRRVDLVSQLEQRAAFFAEACDRSADRLRERLDGLRGQLKDFLTKR